MSPSHNNYFHYNYNIYSGSSDFSLKFLFFFIYYFKFLYILPSTDNIFVYNILKIFCLKKKNIFIQFKNIFFYNNFFYNNIYIFNKLKKANFNFLFTTDYSFIFSLFFIKLFYKGIINMHTSNLPLWKGGRPLENQNIFYNFIFSFNIYFIEKFLDFGKIIYINKFYINRKIFLKKIYLKFIIYFIIFFKNILNKIFKYFYFFCFNQYYILNIKGSKKIK
ncbi:10-formyltetrahydrofolate:L-methionyl-tRNA N-formyltransferase [Candidatus Nasuia deltocephalinicola]|uniref:10-formyltetrahydrofolate:L-methionyl-tRNA N-formyltransferase n=1 Tax=Candidatus Nasuia deltocephalincola TaxID=1160784 RepID=A0A0S2UP69_9PROT|nr:10-formyltetrahydrofolate:L-methionyl-tRNA N-formyltransferase [Candidatus Nasuia deltocephalinicola]